MPESLITSLGLVGGRGWAMRDDTRQEVQWVKMYPQLMVCSARYRQEPVAGSAAPVEITFPDGSVLGSDHPDLHHKLGERCGCPASR